MGELDGSPLLESDSLEDNLLAVLCRFDDSRAALRRILARIGRLPPKAADNAMAKLLILSKLRRLPQIVVEEQQNMPVPIDPDILDHPWLRDLVLQREREAEARGEARGKARGEARGEAQGAVRGEANLLGRMLERRFGPLPDWARRRIESADTVTLETWGLRLIDAPSLEDVLQ